MRGRRFRKVVAYESWTARAKFLSQPRMDYCAIFILKIAFFPPKITASFCDKIISYFMWQFINESALTK